MVYELVYDISEFGTRETFELMNYIKDFFWYDDIECIVSTSTRIVEFKTDNNKLAYQIIEYFIREKLLPIETNFDILKFYNNKN